MQHPDNKGLKLPLWENMYTALQNRYVEEVNKNNRTRASLEMWINKYNENDEMWNAKYHQSIHRYKARMYLLLIIVLVLNVIHIVATHGLLR